MVRLKIGDRVKAGLGCRLAPEEAYVSIWINEGEAGTVVDAVDYVEFAEARPVPLGSPAEATLRDRGGHERRRFVRLTVKFDAGLTATVDAASVVPA